MRDPSKDHTLLVQSKTELYKLESNQEDLVLKLLLLEKSESTESTSFHLRNLVPSEASSHHHLPLLEENTESSRLLVEIDLNLAQ